MKPFSNLTPYFPNSKIQVWTLSLTEHHDKFIELTSSLGFDADQWPQKQGKQWRQYWGGRLCAFKGAQELNLPLNRLDKLESGAPDWPDFIRGSISHSKSLAMAVIAARQNYDSIGCDIEEIVSQKRIEVIKRMALSDDEQLLLETMRPEQRAYGATAFFSAKESLYKLINPLAHTYLNFSEGIVTHLDLDRGDFTIELRSLKKEVSAYCGPYKGWFTLVNNNVVTLMTYQKP